MTAIDQLHQLWAHVRWANAEVARALDALRETPLPSFDQARRELAHLAGAEEVWLSRLEGRPSRATVWPDLSLADAAAPVDFIAFVRGAPAARSGGGDARAS